MRVRYQHRPLWAGMFALFSLVLLPAGLFMPFLTVEKFGSMKAFCVLDGIEEMHLKGLRFVALIVLLCSVVFPLFKNVVLIALSISMYRGGRGCAWLQSVLTVLSKLSFLNVFVVSILISAVKFRSVFEVAPATPGLPAFTASVVLAIVSSIVLPKHSTFEVTDSERSPSMNRPRMRFLSFVALAFVAGIMCTIGAQLYSPLRSSDISHTFDNVDGIRPGALVKDKAGVEVGTVVAVTSAPDNKAKVFMRFNAGQSPPAEDSTFKIEGGMQISLTSGMSGSFEARFVRFERAGDKRETQVSTESSPVDKARKFVKAISSADRT